MAVQTITYGDKSYLNQNADIPATNKVQDVDMNEIKEVVNNNAQELINKTQLNFCLMNTSSSRINITTSQIITSWENPINYGDYVADVTNSRLIITNSTVIEVSGASCGSGNAAIEYVVTDSNNVAVTQLNSTALIDYGDKYWASSLKNVIYILDPTKTYYIQLKADVYSPTTTFAMNNGFNKKSTWISAKKIL